MQLHVGARLSFYEILAPIGAGGMGEVYRARDTRLGRDVAIKILPSEVARDPERLARFRREAQLLASLNHPHIAAIHGLEEVEGRPFLILELVEGETLAERLMGGPLAVQEATEMARQIIEALDEAHEKGIVHRDLKPANIKITPEGKVKVLDFGLAKAFVTDEPAASDSSQSPTLTRAGTVAGVLLGTAAYMSPEQARGKSVDKRADIWAFGAVVFEMLTGRRAFSGETVSDTLATVLKQEPDWDRLPGGVPARLHEVLRQCLAKNPSERLRDIGDARIDAHGTPPARNERPRRAFVALAAFALALATVLGMVFRGGAPDTPARVLRLSVPLPADKLYEINSWPGHSIAIAPDGSTIAYVARDARDGVRRVFLRALDDLELRPLAGSEDAHQPFFSPDGKWLAFFTLDGGRLTKVSVSGGPPVTLVRDNPSRNWALGSWSDDGSIVYDTWGAGLRVVTAEGGTPRALTSTENELHLDPQMLPGTDVLVFTIQSDDGHRLELLSIDGTRRKHLLDNASHSRYLASGHLLFMRDGGLMVAPFDTSRLELTGPAVPLPTRVKVDHRLQSAPVPQLAVSREGTLVYVPTLPAFGEETTLVWFEGPKEAERLPSVPVASPYFQLARDGGRLALVEREGPLARYQILDLDRLTLTLVTEFAVDHPSMPVWFPDGRRVVVARHGIQEGELWSYDVDGSTPPRRLAAVEGTWIAPGSFSPDGRFLAFSVYRNDSITDIWVLKLGEGDDEEGELSPFAATPAYEMNPVFSPDGRWIAYASDESGEIRVYARRFPGMENKTTISRGHGINPLWSRDGRKLFFASGYRVLAVEVETGATLKVGEPQVLFDLPYEGGSDLGRSFDVSADGRLLVAELPEDPRRASELVVVLNWFAELEKLAPTKN